MSAPRILISGSAKFLTNYANAITYAGGTACAYYCPPLSTDYDGLLLCGGEDVHPSYYGQEDEGCNVVDRDRDAAEIPLAQAFAAAGKPIFGICRGHQLVNVALGGTLHQHIGDIQCLFHVRNIEKAIPRVHPIRATEGSVLHGMYGASFVVNSSHHQAVDRLAEGMVATAWSESGIVECIEHQTLPILGVQYHPEVMSYARRRPDTVDGAPLFERFMELCRGERTGW